MPSKCKVRPLEESTLSTISFLYNFPHEIVCGTYQKHVLAAELEPKPVVLRLNANLSTLISYLHLWSRLYTCIATVYMQVSCFAFIRTETGKAVHGQGRYRAKGRAKTIYYLEESAMKYSIFLFEINYFILTWRVYGKGSIKAQGVCQSSVAKPFFACCLLHVACIWQVLETIVSYL